MAFKFAASGTGTDAELLALVREAITVVLVTGQEYELRGRRYTRADLDDLRLLEKELQARIGIAAGSSRNYARLKRKVK